VKKVRQHFNSQQNSLLCRFSFTVFAQIPEFALVGASEVFTSISGEIILIILVLKIIL
jgi:hypothetical protein